MPPFHRSDFALVAGLALLVAGCGPRPATVRPPAPIALDALLGFSDPARCRVTADHARFLAAMVAGDGRGAVRAGRIDAPPALAAAFGPVTARRTDGYWVVGTSVSGTLYGLPLGRIDHALPEGGDAGDVTYRFDVPAAAAATTLRRRGFPVTAGRSTPIDGGDLVMTLVANPRNPDFSLFGCGHE